MVSDGKTQIAGLTLIAVGFSLILSAYSFKHPKLASIGARVFITIQRPLSLGINEIFGGIESLWSKYFFLVGLQEHHEELKKRYLSLERERNLFLELQYENQRLKTLLNANSAFNVQGTMAKVIGSDAASWSQTLVVDKGSKSGVISGTAALAAMGVVGVVSDVSEYASKVVILTDPTSGVDVVLQGSRSRAVAEGAGREILKLKFLLKEEGIKIGERIITSGLDGVFPAGVPVGIITEIASNPSGMFHSIEAVPSVEINKLEEILLVSSPPTVIDAARLLNKTDRQK